VEKFPYCLPLVTIPRSGLRTQGFESAVGHESTASPSHTVGLEQKDKDFVEVSHAFIKSPSHAVGSEREQGDSIPVGHQAGGGADVTIPRSGLRTKEVYIHYWVGNEFRSPSHTGARNKIRVRGVPTEVFRSRHPTQWA